MADKQDNTFVYIPKDNQLKLLRPRVFGDRATDSPTQEELDTDTELHGTYDLSFKPRAVSLPQTSEQRYAERVTNNLEDLGDVAMDVWDATDLLHLPASAGVGAMKAIIPLMSQATQRKYITKFVNDLGKHRLDSYRDLLAQGYIKPNKKFLEENEKWMTDLERTIVNLPENAQDAWLISTMDNLHNADVKFIPSKNQMTKAGEDFFSDNKGVSFFQEAKNFGDKDYIQFRLDAEPSTVIHEIAHETDRWINGNNTWASVENNLHEPLEEMVVKYAEDNAGEIPTARGKLLKTLRQNNLPDEAASMMADMRSVSAENPSPVFKGYGHKPSYVKEKEKQFGTPYAAMDIEGFADTYQTIPTVIDFLSENPKLGQKFNKILADDHRRARAPQFVPKEFIANTKPIGYDADDLQIQTWEQLMNEAAERGDWNAHKRYMKLIDGARNDL